MKRNPWIVALVFVGAFFVLVLAALSAAFYTAFGEKTQTASNNSILVLEVRGVIVDSRPFIKLIEKYREDKDVKAIVIRLDSPGGVVGPSQEIYNEILKTRQMGKHVVASLGSVAASGAYYIAAACEKIVTDPGTITGSIGVIMEFANLSGLYSWAKVDRYVIKSGLYKDIGSDTRAMTPAEKSILQSMIDNVYMQFKKAVATGRHMKLEDVAKLADGRIFSGEQAVSNGLADELGGLNEAVERASKLAAVKGKPEIFTPPVHKKKIWDVLFDRGDDDDDRISRAFEKAFGFEYLGKPLYLMQGVR
jgi:protease-4